MTCHQKLCVICGRPTPTGRHVTCGDEACQKARRQQTTEKYLAKKRQARRLTRGPLIRCEVCGGEQEVISPPHLARHGLTMVAYREMYPDAPLACEAVRKARATLMDRRRKYLFYDGRQPDQRLYSFLTGTMLGDGSLIAPSIHAHYQECGANQAYMRFKHAFLEAYFPTALRERVSRPDPRTGKQYRHWEVRTTVHPTLTEWRKEWYAPSKVLSRSLVEQHLDEFALAIWFFDDGHLWRHQRNACFCTQDFSEEDSAFLSEFLARRFRIESRVRLDSKSQPLLYLGRPGRERLLEIITPLVAPGMAYKVGRA